MAQHWHCPTDAKEEETQRSRVKKRKKERERQRCDSCDRREATIEERRQMSSYPALHSKPDKTKALDINEDVFRSIQISILIL